MMPVRERDKFVLVLVFTSMVIMNGGVGSSLGKTLCFNPAMGEVFFVEPHSWASGRKK